MTPSGQVMRKKYPDRVPLVCHGEAVDGVERQTKLLVPAGYTVAQLKKTISEKVPGVDAERLRLGGELQQDGGALVRDLDQRLRAADDFLYARFDGAFEPPLRGADQDRVSEAGDEGKKQHHLPDCDPEDPEVEESCGDSASVAASPDDVSIELVTKLQKRHPDRVPVICRQAPRPGLPGIDKKLLVPLSMLCSEFKDVVRKQSTVTSVDAWENLTLFADGVQLNPKDPVSKAYERHQGDDSVLRVAFGASLAEALAQVEAANALRFGPPQEPSPCERVEAACSEQERALELEQVKAQSAAAVEEALLREGAELERANAAERERDEAAARLREREQQLAEVLRERERQMAQIAAALGPVAGTAAHDAGDALVERVQAAVSELVRKSRELERLQLEHAEREERAAELSEALQDSARRAEAAEQRVATLERELAAARRRGADAEADDGWCHVQDDPWTISSPSTGPE